MKMEAGRVWGQRNLAHGGSQSGTEGGRCQNLAWPWLVKEIGIVPCTLAPILKSPLLTLLMAKSYPNIPSHPGCQKSREKHRFMILNFWWDLQTNALFLLRGFLILKFSICRLKVKNLEAQNKILQWRCNWHFLPLPSVIFFTTSSQVKTPRLNDLNST